MLNLFESREQRSKDALEVRGIFVKYGDDALPILESRVKDSSMSSRDRRHWKRILRKARAEHRKSADNYRDKITTH